MRNRYLFSFRDCLAKISRDDDCAKHFSAPDDRAIRERFGFEDKKSAARSREARIGFHLRALRDGLQMIDFNSCADTDGSFGQMRTDGLRRSQFHQPNHCGS